LEEGELNLIPGESKAYSDLEVLDQRHNEYLEEVNAI